MLRITIKNNESVEDGQTARIQVCTLEDRQEKPEGPPVDIAPGEEHDFDIDENRVLKSSVAPDDDEEEGDEGDDKEEDSEEEKDE